MTKKSTKSSKNTKFLVLFITIDLPTKNAPILFHKEISHDDTSGTNLNSGNEILDKKVSEISKIIFNDLYFSEKKANSFDTEAVNDSLNIFETLLDQSDQVQ